MGFPMDANLPEKPCEWCKVPFKPASTRARYHSTECRAAANNEKFCEKRRQKKAKAKG